MRGLRALPVRYEIVGPVPQLAPARVPDVPDAPAAPDRPAGRRFSLWRYLTGLIRQNT